MVRLLKINRRLSHLNHLSIDVIHFVFFLQKNGRIYVQYSFQFRRGTVPANRAWNFSVPFACAHDTWSWCAPMPADDPQAKHATEYFRNAFRVAVDFPGWFGVSFVYLICPGPNCSTNPSHLWTSDETKEKHQINVTMNLSLSRKRRAVAFYATHLSHCF